MDIFLFFAVIFFPSLTRPLKWKRGHILHVKYEIRDLCTSSQPIRLLIFFELTTLLVLQKKKKNNLTNYKTIKGLEEEEWLICYYQLSIILW